MANSHANDLLYLDGLIEQLRKRAENVNTFWLKSIGKRIRELKKMDPSDAAGIAAIRNDTSLIADILDAVQSVGNDTVEDAKTLLRTAARLSMEASPVAQGLALDSWISGVAEATQGRLQNIANTTVVGVLSPDGFRTPQEAYIRAIDEVAAQMASGELGLKAGVRRVLKQLADSGLSVVEYESGRTRSLAASIEMNLKEATSQVYQGVQRRVGEEFGADGFEISAHWDCAPDHLDVQGRQYTMKEYEKLNASLSRPIGTLNCRHTIYSIIIGVSEPTYSNAELSAMKDASLRKTEFDGKEMTNYEASQMQRRLERSIRQQKNRSVIAKAAGDDEMRREAQMKINQMTGKYKELSDKFGLPTKSERMAVSGYRPVKVQKAYSIFPGVDKYNNNKPHHPVTDEIQNAASFDELRKLIVQRRPVIGLQQVLTDSIGSYSLDVQKELAEGLLWAKKNIRIKTWPESISRATLGKDELGRYYKGSKRIEFRPSLTIEQAFPTAVHEMIHHSESLKDVDCDKIISKAAEALGLDRRTNKFKNMLTAIAAKEKGKPDEVIAYSISACSVGKGNELAKKIFEIYLKGK